MTGVQTCALPISYELKEKAAPARFAALRKNQTFLPPNGYKMPAVGYNVFGFPVYSNLIIKGAAHYDNAGNVIAKFNDIRIDCVIMELEGENQLITTDIQGRTGTIIEYVGAKSYNVHCYGRFLADTAGVYPEADVAEFVRAMNANVPLQVSSWFLGMAGVYAIQIKKHSIHQEEGSQEYQKFEFDAMADAPVLLKQAKAATLPR